MYLFQDQIRAAFMSVSFLQKRLLFRHGNSKIAHVAHPKAPFPYLAPYGQNGQNTKKGGKFESYLYNFTNSV